MTMGLGRMVSMAFKPDTPEIPEAGFGKIRCSKPQIMGTIVVPSWTDGEAGPVTAGNGRTRGSNPLMAGGVCPFPEFDDPEFVSDAIISSMTTEEDGARVTWPRRFNKYSC